MHTKKTRGGKKQYQEASELLKKEKKNLLVKYLKIGKIIRITLYSTRNIDMIRRILN